MGFGNFKMAVSIVSLLTLAACGENRCDMKACGISLSGEAPKGATSMSPTANAESNLVETNVTGKIITEDGVFVNNESYSSLSAFYAELNDSMLGTLQGMDVDAVSYTLVADDVNSLWKNMELYFSGTDSLSLTSTKTTVGDDATFNFLFHYVKNSVPDVNIFGFKALPLNVVSSTGEVQKFCLQFTFLTLSKKVAGIKVNQFLSEIDKSQCVDRFNVQPKQEAPQEAPQDASQDVQQGVHQDVPQDMPQDQPQDIPQDQTQVDSAPSSSDQVSADSQQDGQQDGQQVSP